MLLHLKFTLIFFLVTNKNSEVYSEKFTIKIISENELSRLGFKLQPPKNACQHFTFG